MSADRAASGTDDATAAYRDAARRWFADTAGPDAFRRGLEHASSGRTPADRRAAWESLRGFGLDAILAESEAADQARIAAAVGIEAGRALYAGPLLEGSVRALCGSAAAGARYEIGATFGHGVPAEPLAAVDAPAGTRRIQGTLPAVPYADLADTLIVPVRLGTGRALVAVPAVAAAAAGEAGPSPAPATGPGRQVDGTARLDLRIDGDWRDGEVIAHEAPDGDPLARIGDLLLLSTSARLVGVALRAGEITQEYLGMRRQFGKVLGGFQALQHRAVDGHVEATLAGALLWRLTADWATLAPRRALLLALKSLAAKTALQLARDGVQMFGGMGFSDEGPVGIYLKHAMVLAARYGGEARARRLFREQAPDLLSWR